MINFIQADTLDELDKKTKQMIIENMLNNDVFKI